jgi:hypothetical protein
VKPEELAAILAGCVVTAVLMIFLLAVLLLAGCASTPAELAAKDAELHERLQPWRYHAVSKDGHIICLAGDRPCHELLERSFLMRGHWVHE